MFDPYGVIVDFLFLVMIPLEILVLLLADVIKAVRNRYANKPQQPEPQPVKRHKRRKPRDEREDSEFEQDDIDAEIDEMPDDSLIYDLFN